jgi:CubicO group peptidase (beta-lactamase class C family)
VNQETKVTLELKKGEEKVKDYTWDSERGAINGSGKEVIYQAPATTGEDKVQVALKTRSGADISAEAKVQVAKTIVNGNETEGQFNIQASNSWFSLDYPEEIRKGQKIEFKGVTSSDIERVKLELDEYEIGDIEVKNHFYSLTTRFNTPGEDRKLLIKAYNQAGDRVAAVKKEIDVRDGSDRLPVEEINAKAKQIKEEYGLVGMSVAAVKRTDGELETIFSKGYGLANQETNKPVTEDTIYRVASISKTVTATAIMQLAEAGKLDIDADISRYLGFELRNPYYPNTKITLRQLMAHTSSIRNGAYSNFYQDTRSSLASGRRQPSLEELFKRYKTWFKYKPGTSFTYSNLTPGVLATVVERVSGQRFDEYCRANIFAPLNMDNTTFNRNEVSSDNFAMMYRGNRRQSYYPGGLPLSSYEVGKNASIFSPWGGLLTTAEDLAKFMQLHMEGRENVLDSATIEKMQETNWSKSQGYEFMVFDEIGLQFQLTEDVVPGERMIGHMGGAYGLLSDMYFTEDGDFGLVFITNGGESHESVYGNRSPYYRVEEEVFDLLYDHFGE